MHDLLRNLILRSAKKLSFGLNWSEDQPEAFQKLSMHLELSGGITGTYFFKNAANRNVPVFFNKLKRLTSMTCGLNKTVPYATKTVPYDRLDRGIIRKI